MYCSFIKIQKNLQTYCSIRQVFRRYAKYSSRLSAHEMEENVELQELIKKYDYTLQYNSVLESRRFNLGYHRSRALEQKIERKRELVKQQMQLIEPLPLSLRYVTDIAKIAPQEQEQPPDVVESKVITFPYANTTTNSALNSKDDTKSGNLNTERDIRAEEEIQIRYQKLKDMKNWMASYDTYNDAKIMEVDDDGDDLTVNYGTPDPTMSISDVPCGGCGAHLHCKDTAIPGYIPSEIFKNHNRRGGSNLQAIICQRCYFLKNYNMALQVNVSPEDYPKMLLNIRERKALVVLLVDLTDFPCSIWPGIADIVGSRTPIIIAGNKVDLIPKDDLKFLTHIRKTLMDYCKLNGFATCNIKNISLISAKTGFGIEDLITTLQSTWQYNGDVYLVGCTNSGKSSLFNALLKSDYCRVQAMDLVQRATTSLWPGTTLNLLKFPIMRMAGFRMALRHQRLKEAHKLFSQEKKHRQDKLSEYNSPKYATLIGHIGRSYTLPLEDEKKDPFGVTMSSTSMGIEKMGIDENHPEYSGSKWCYDTPGVVQPDQIINLLTTDELMLTLPRELIRTETFCVKPRTSLFIAGLGRLDYVAGKHSVRLTVFRSNDLPVTVCDLDVADQMYEDFLGKELFVVPINTSDRMTKWPGLEKAREFTVNGTTYNLSTKDVVLSSAGWIAISVQLNHDAKFVAWTPEKRGCYVRDCLLPKAVLLRGKRKRESPAYHRHRFI